MLPLLLALALMMTPHDGGSANPPAQRQVVATGVAAMYGQGVMEAIYQNRLRMGHVMPCAECVGYVALVDCGKLNSRVWLRHDGITSGPYLAVDCAARKDLPAIRQRNIVAEVSFEQARAWGMTGPVPVEVWEEQP